jgi:thiol-disulfide isomerase/thioredoxin
MQPGSLFQLLFNYFKMNKYKLSVLLMCFMAIIISCDIVEEPYTNTIIQPPDTGEVLQKVLLEEFTGHQCPNCPAGAKIAAQLDELYGDQFIIMAYHAGFFANTNASFPINYKTPTGEELKGHFGVISYPSGLVNRNNGEVLGTTEWATIAADLISQEPKLKLQINKDYNTSTRELCVTVTATAISSMESMYVCVFLTESGLISPQKTNDDLDYPDGIIPDYVHNHVFRNSMNGTWGTNIFTDGAAIDEIETLSVSCILNSEWNVANMDIVCFAYCIETGEVIQVEEVGIQ